MKTIITASALILVSNIAMASSWEDNWHSPDLNSGVYDKPQTLMAPMSSKRDVAVSLDDFSRGNSDHAAHDRAAQGSSVSSGKSATTSLDEFSAGNPDHV